MEIVNIEARSKKKLSLSEEVISKLPKKLCIFTTIQHIDSIKKIKTQLEASGRKVVLKKTRHSTYRGQLLGCGIDKIEGDFDAFLFMGEGMFPPKALLLNNEKEVICWNPNTKKTIVLGKKEREDFLKDKKKRISCFLRGRKIGLLVSTKPGQYYKPVEKIIKNNFSSKQIYWFIGDTINIESLEDFNFIDCFVNCACPRIAIDNPSNKKKVIDISEVLELVASENVKN